MPVRLQCGIRVARLASLASIAAVAIAGCGGGSGPAAAAAPRTIVWGAGTEIDFPIYEEAGSLLTSHGITLNYQLVGPTAAMSGFEKGKLAFVAADGSSPSPVALAAIRRGSAVSLPVARWGVAMIYDVPGLRVRLKLDGKTLANIFTGKVTTWDNREIARQNPGVRLPALAIKVVERKDPSVETELLTRYLAASSRHWRRSIGVGDRVRWPGGTADVGDANVVRSVALVRGAIGYTEQTEVLQTRIAAAALRTTSGAYVAPTLSSTTTGTYPLIANAYVLTYRDLCDAGLTATETDAAERFLAYLLGPGQGVVKRLSFSPLPARVRARALAEVRRLTCGSQPIA